MFEMNKAYMFTKCTCYDPSTIQPDLIQLWFKYFRVLGVGEREKRGSKRKEIASANHILPPYI
jgi:hypothetical protein